MVYEKQFNRLILSYVRSNRKLISTTASCQTLYDAAFMIQVGKFIRLAQKFGLLKIMLDDKFTLEASYQVMAISTDELIDALKYFAVISYAVEFGENPGIPLASLQKWQQATLTVFAPFKANLTKPIGLISKLLSNPATKYIDSKGEPTKAYETLNDQTKIIRDTLYPKKGRILADPSATANLRTFITNIFTYFNSKSEPSFKAITQNVRYLNDPKLSSILHVPSEQVDNAPIKKYLSWIAKKTDRKNPIYLLPEEHEQLSERDKELHKQLRLEHNKAYKAKLLDIIRTSGKSNLPAVTVKKTLQSEGFPHWGIPKGFTGNIDEKGALYTHTGLPLATGQAGGEMIMNPEWDPKEDDSWYAKGKSTFATGNAYQSFYTQRYVKNNRQAKKAKLVGELEDKMEDMQKAWRKDLMPRKGTNTPDNKIKAAMVEALYQTQARIGSASNKTAGEKTYGLSTWLNKQVKVGANNTVTIIYPGKKGMINKHVLRPETTEQKALIEYIKELKTGKLPNDPIWAEGDSARATAGDVRKYLKELGFSGGAHKFRNAKGTALFREQMEAKPLKKANPTPKEVDTYHKFLTTRVGAILGHQRTKADGSTENVGSTAARSYIDPEIQKKLYRDKKVPVPKWLEAISGGAD